MLLLLLLLLLGFIDVLSGFSTSEWTFSLQDFLVLYCCYCYCRECRLLLLLLLLFAENWNSYDVLSLSLVFLLLPTTLLSGGFSFMTAYLRQKFFAALLFFFCVFRFLFLFFLFLSFMVLWWRENENSSFCAFSFSAFWVFARRIYNFPHCCTFAERCLTMTARTLATDSSTTSSLASRTSSSSCSLAATSSASLSLWLLLSSDPP